MGALAFSKDAQQSHRVDTRLVRPNFRHHFSLYSYFFPWLTFTLTNI